MPGKFTYPFCYKPAPEIREAALELCSRIDASDELRGIFGGGKMMGVLEVEGGGFLYAFSGLAGGRAVVEGFVPPIFDLTPPEGHFKVREREISGEQDPEKRKAMSAELQDWLFDQYVVRNARGESESIRNIFAGRGLVPPGGTGDCAGPKLLQYAYVHGLVPVAMGEFWYGDSPRREVRRSGAFYPSCMGKCGPLLSYMLGGLDVEANPLDAPFEFETEPEIRFEDDTVLIVRKPYGMLSARGKTAKECLEDWVLRNRGIEVYSCHRLDMDTAGLMVFAKTLDAQKELRRQFAQGEVEKTYLAKLCPPVQGSRRLTEGHRGTICLPLALDYYDRPRQMVTDEGRKAVTRYEILKLMPDGTAFVRFTPLTGRTHQLRVHAAHQDGLGRPIVGDRLYGGTDHAVSGAGGNLNLLADSLSFCHPSTGKGMKFKLDMPAGGFPRCPQDIETGVFPQSCF